MKFCHHYASVKTLKMRLTFDPAFHLFEAVYGCDVIDHKSSISFPVVHGCLGNRKCEINLYTFIKKNIK